MREYLALRIEASQKVEQAVEKGWTDLRIWDARFIVRFCGRRKLRRSPVLR